MSCLSGVAADVKQQRLDKGKDRDVGAGSSTAQIQSESAGMCAGVFRRAQMRRGSSAQPYCGASFCLMKPGDAFSKRAAGFGHFLENRAALTQHRLLRSSVSFRLVARPPPNLHTCISLAEKAKTSGTVSKAQEHVDSWEMPCDHGCTRLYVGALFDVCCNRDVWL
jgi:hypothetical protein